MNAQICEEATAWFVDFRAAAADANRNAEFMRWLCRSPEHIQAYIEIAGSYAALPPSNAIQGPDLAALLERVSGRAHVVDVPHFGSAPIHKRKSIAGLPSYKVGRDSGRWRRPLAITAALALVCALALLVVWTAYTPSEVFSTRLGEQHFITLDDGSRIELNSLSKVRVHFSEHERRVDLLAGQALFQVAKDPNRPFLVASDRTLVRAIGTEFDVYRKPTGTVITVLEGRVAVFAEAHAPAQALAAGQQMTIAQGIASKVSPAKLPSATAWTQHELEFDETPLSDVVEEFNRQNKRSLVIGSPALKDFRISGVYASTDPASLVRFLRMQPGISVIETSAEIRIVQQ